VLAAAGAALLALAAFLAWRTVQMGRQPPPPVSPPSPLAMDGEAAAERLAGAIRIATVTSQSGTDQNALARFRAWLAQNYPQIHAEAPPLVLAGGTLLYRWRGSDPNAKPIVLMAHQDVVPAQEGWSIPPFSGERSGGFIWGRGAVDDKSSLVAIFEAVETLLRHGFRPRRDVYLLFGHDEEGSGSGARAAAGWFRQQRIRAQFVLDEGSAVIKDHPVTDSPVALIGIAEKGYATLRVTAETAGGHSSAPPSDTAVSRLARSLVAIAGKPFPRRYGGATAAMLEGLAPQLPWTTRMAVANSWLFAPLLKAVIGETPQGAAMLRTTVAPTMLEGSAKENVLATRASALINYRIAPEDSAAIVLARTRAAAGRDVRVEFAAPPQEPSPVSRTDSPGYRAIAGLASQLSGAPAVPSLVIAATDSRAMVDVADDIYRFQPILLSLADTEMIHGRNERLSQRDLERMLRFYADLLRATAG
jgi:carboxypeptidase PM20D1